jgi:hypothetical protein
MIRVRCATRNVALRESTNSWPTSAIIEVLRDTIGERFLCDQKRPLFVNEFVHVIRVHEHKSSFENLRARIPGCVSFLSSDVVKEKKFLEAVRKTK